MSRIEYIKKGQSLDFVFDRGGKSIAGYTCTITVKKYPHSVAEFSRVVPAVGDEWPGFITGSESAGLEEGQLYYINAKLTHAVNDAEDAVPVRFFVSRAWS